MSGKALGGVLFDEADFFPYKSTSDENGARTFVCEMENERGTARTLSPSPASTSSAGATVRPAGGVPTG